MKKLNKDDRQLIFLTLEQYEDRGITGIKVSYVEGKPKTFDTHYWIAFRAGIIKQLYNRNLCEIKFIYQKTPTV